MDGVVTQMVWIVTYYRYNQSRILSVPAMHFRWFLEGSLFKPAWKSVIATPGTGGTIPRPSFRHSAGVFQPFHDHWP